MSNPPADSTAEAGPQLNLRDRLATSDLIHRIRTDHAGKTIAVGASCALILIAGSYLAFGPDAPAPIDPTTTTTVAAPADGTLTVGTVTVEQMVGTCTDISVEQTKASQGGKSCSYAPASSELARVTSPAGTLALNSGTSTSYSVSVVDVTAPGSPAAITTAGKTLIFPNIAPGDYRVTALGDAGGAWQFILTVTGSSDVTGQPEPGDS